MNGAAGKMGSLICSLLLDEADIALTEAFDHAQSPFIGHDLGISMGIEEWGLKIEVLDRSKEYKMKLLADFSSPDGFRSSLEYAYSKKIAFLSGTTGLNEDDIKRMKEYSKKIPIFYSANMSTGINRILSSLDGLKEILSDSSRDIEILEKHHNKKKDSPSGTALLLADRISKLSRRKIRKDSMQKYPRNSDIIVHSMRLSDVAGEHTVIVSGAGETIEITHKAHTRETFARGAVKALRFMKDRKKGFYNFEDIMKEA